MDQTMTHCENDVRTAVQSRPRPAAEARDAVSSKTSILRHFRGKHVLLTGVTGLLGTVILEKLLRCVSDIGSITLLIRPKASPRGGTLDATRRFREEVLTKTLFGTLRRRHGRGWEGFLDRKLRVLEGNLLEERLGQSHARLRDLCERVDVVIHSAATVNLHERLDLALSLNVQAPLRILDFARAAGASLVQVSTAYVCGCIDGIAPEGIVDPQDLLAAHGRRGSRVPRDFDVAQEVSRLEQTCAEIVMRGAGVAVQRGWSAHGAELRGWIRARMVRAGLERSRGLGWMDTYTYTKFLGEQMIARRRGAVPTVIVRPSIIESALRDPLPGWLESYRMADPVIVSFGKGRLFDFPGRAHAPLDLVPVDLVVNCILASAASLERRDDRLDVVQIATSARNPLTLEHLHAIKKRYYRARPLRDRQGRGIPVPDWRFISQEEFMGRYDREKGAPTRQALRILRHAGATDPRQARAVRAQWVEYQKIRSMADHYGPYTTMHCIFADDRAARLMSSLDPGERRTFGFDPSQFNWEDYLCRVHIPGVERNILRLENR